MHNIFINIFWFLVIFSFVGYFCMLYNLYVVNKLFKEYEHESNKKTKQD
jgi:hypothetical protein